MSAPLQLSLFDYERAIERALEDVEAAWVTIAANLRAIHGQGLYKAQYGTWARYCQERWGKTGRWGYQLLEAGAVLENVNHGSHVGYLPESERQVRPLVGLPSPDQATVWREAVRRHGTPTGAQVAAVVEERRTGLRLEPAVEAWGTQMVLAPDPSGQVQPEAVELLTQSVVNEVILAGKSPQAAIAETIETMAPWLQPEPDLEPEQPAPSVHFTSDTQEWYTPPAIIDAVLTTLGGIDLDPCSNEGAPNVPAASHFTVRDDGLSRRWEGNVYVNPPYADAAAWVDKLVESVASGDVGTAVLLVPARTDTRWWARLVPYPVCFISGRLRFLGGKHSAPFPSAAIYLGRDLSAFMAAFARLGPIYAAVSTEEVE